jgi:stress-induced morphogen
MGDPNFVPGAMKAGTISQKIESGFSKAEVLVNDPNGDGYHFEVVVVSDDFKALSRIQRHQKVYGLLQEEFKQAIHALTLKTYTQEEWENLE